MLPATPTLLDALRLHSQAGDIQKQPAGSNVLTAHTGTTKDAKVQKRRPDDGATEDKMRLLAQLTTAANLKLQADHREKREDFAKAIAITITAFGKELRVIEESLHTALSDNAALI